MYRIRILRAAQDDMKSILAYIRMDDPEAAVRMVERIRESIGKLADHPFIGSIARDKTINNMGYRMLVIKPYLVFYVVIIDDKTVEIHRVLHGKRNYSDML